MRIDQGWAEREFGDARFGDRRLTDRLVQTAGEVAAHPAGKVTVACASAASREGAFRFLENSAVLPDTLLSCVTEATIRRSPCAGTVIVPIDSTSLQITDRKRSKGLGVVGARSMAARGFQAMTALALTSKGQPIGIVAQKKWTRVERSTRRDRDRLESGGESAYWVEVLEDCQHAFSFKPEVKPWYQLDRGGDCWQVLQHAIDNGLLITIRATHDRNLADDLLDDNFVRLSEALEAAPIVAEKSIKVRACGKKKKHKRVGNRRRIKKTTPARNAGRARLSIRACRVPILLARDGDVVELNAVYVSERSNSDDAIRWVLLTTHPINSKKNALKVVEAYALRWRIEDFHRTWKNGLCRVEDTQLRSRSAIFKWATLLATVATRAMRLTHQARLTPDAPATSEFSPIELEALIAIRNPKKMPADGNITLALAVHWLAETGGYTGRWNGPPGVTIIGRALNDLCVVARAFQNRDAASARAKKK
jgi:hypothetical protein